MPLLHDDRRTINKNDIRALEEMLKGSIENIISRLEFRKENTENAAEADLTYDPVIKAYRDGLNSLPDLLQAAQNSPKETTVSEFIQKVYNDMADAAIATLDPDQDNYGDVTNALYYEAGGRHITEKLFPEVGAEDRDKPEVYQKQVDTFTFADEPMEGIEDIADYKPESGRILGLYEGRAGNSNTLNPEWIRQQEERVENSKDNVNSEAYKDAAANLQKTKTASFGLHAGAEYTRIRSSEMMAKEHITFSDVYETFTNINKMTRPGYADAGKLHGGPITALNIKGPSAAEIPSQGYKMLTFIADKMNEIKQTPDEALRKTRAIQLAAFAYQMGVSEHLFTDGNGRSSRLFADSILQTFGLPPHIPSKEEEKIIKTLGEGMDFEKGAEIFLENVKKSDLELKKDPKIVTEKLASKMPEKKPGGIQEEYSTKLSAIYEVNDDTVQMLRTLNDQAKHAKGRFRDSQEYKDFLKAIETSLTLASEINANRDKEGFNLKEADAKYSSSVRKLLKSANDYKEYKFKDKTADQQAEPGKKKLNKDDRKKLDVIDSLTENKALIKVKKEPEGPQL